MRILLLGKNGQLGSELQRLLPPLGQLTSLARNDLDLRDVSALQSVLRALKPDVILNAAAYTAVDRAESEPDQAFQVNALAPGIMAKTARDLGAAFIHYSTDYVFDGRKGAPYIEDDPPAPLNVYGNSKLDGEKRIQQAGGAFLILRTSWVYSLRGNSFVNKVLEWAHQEETLRIVNDQIGNPTWSRELANITFQLLRQNQAEIRDLIRERRGIYHLAGNGFVSRYEWARQILIHASRRTGESIPPIEPVATDAFPAPARRPSFSALDCSKFRQTFRLSLPDWSASLRVAMMEGTTTGI
ncbi:MAG: dTDP-4-dehydrorhamnose reductase [Chloroflexi bacterium]|nr:dTDP-4-dehydrorhamnose reductase [Chloroflexota bacterium]